MKAIISRKKTSGGSYDVSNLFKGQVIGYRRVRQHIGNFGINEGGFTGVSEL